MDAKEKHLELNARKWDKWAGTLDKETRRNRFLREGQARVISEMRLKPDSNFLDIGCGTGYAVNLAAESVGNAGTFYGVDLSARMIEKAQEKFNGRPNFHFMQADSSAVPLESDSFDAIICTHSFHHYLEPLKVMREIYRLLKPSGRIYILDPTADTWFGKFLDRFMGRLEPEHVKLYSTGEFNEMFIEAGLKYVRTEPIKSIEKIHIAEKQPK